MCLSYTTVSTFVYFIFMFCLFPFKILSKYFFSVFICITTNNNKQMLKVIIEICTKILDPLVFISDLTTQDSLQPEAI